MNSGSNIIYYIFTYKCVYYVCTDSSYNTKSYRVFGIGPAISCAYIRIRKEIKCVKFEESRENRVQSNNNNNNA